MKKIGKGSIWRILFIIFFIEYIINAFLMLITHNIMFLITTPVYNIIYLAFSGIFVLILYKSIKKGAMTPKYISIMFILLRFLPFIIALITKGAIFK